MKNKLKYLDILYPLIALGLIIALWAITAKAVDSAIIFPKFSSTMKAFFELFGQKAFYVALGNSLSRVVISFLISFICALVLAIFASRLKAANQILSFMTSIMRAIPTMSIILLALIWLTTMQAPMLVAILVIFPLQFEGILNAILNVDPRLIEMAKIYNVPTKKIILKLYLPETSSGIFSTVRSTISLNVKLIIAAEVMAQTRNSIGVQMQQASLYLEMHVLLAWTIVAVILGLVLEGIVLLVQKSIRRGNKWL